MQSSYTASFRKLAFNIHSQKIYIFSFLLMPTPSEKNFNFCCFANILNFQNIWKIVEKLLLLGNIITDRFCPISIAINERFDSEISACLRRCIFRLWPTDRPACSNASISHWSRTVSARCSASSRSG